MTTRRLLVTGGRGFVGRHVVAKAARDGFEVHAVSRLDAHSGFQSNIHWHPRDLLVEGAAELLINSVRPTHLVHAAWETSPGSYWTDPLNDRWVAVTKALARAFAAVGGRRLIFVGSAAEYDWSHGVMIEDVTPTRPHTLYGASKLAAHQHMQDLADETGVSAVTGRIFFAFGPHENAERFVPYISRNLASGEPALLTAGRQIRDFMHVEDVASALIALLNGTTTGAINIGLGEPVRLAEIAAILGKVSGRPELLQLDARDERPDDVPILVPDTRRLRALGWQPSFTLSEGLAQTYAWWASQITT